MTALSTEDGDDLLVTLPPCDIEGRGTGWASKPFMNGPYALFLLCKEPHTLQSVPYAAT